MNRSTKDREKLTEDEMQIIREKGEDTCPDCTTGPVVEGPSGGLSINRYCINPDCGSRFNDMGPFGWERISDRSPNKPSEAPWSPYPYR
jgi:hypothetical protein